MKAVVESHRLTLSELKDKVQTELENKQKDPNADIDSSSIDKLAVELTELNTGIDDYNAVVVNIVTRTGKFIDNLPQSDVESMRRQLAREREIEKRFKSEWKHWNEAYQNAKNASNDLLRQKTLKQNELNDYTKNIFKTYEKRINTLLHSLGADFEITDLTGKTDERANEPYSDFGFLILKKRIPLSAQQGEPCYKNTLSEGDKSTLAFAFFIATLENAPDLDRQIVVLDDPLSSLDANRREATASLLMQMSPKVNQLCVLTHKKDFYRMLFDKMPDSRTLQIKSDQKNGSRLESYNVEEDRKGEIARLIDDMERYLNEDFGPTSGTMQGNIRKIFEIVLKTKYYRTLAPEIKGKKGFAKLLEVLFSNGLIVADLKSNLFNLCNLSSGPHHGDIAELPERKLSRDELLPLIREALSLIEKV